MVSCKSCAKEGRECRLASLSKKCGNCESNRITKCEPVDVLIPNLAKIDSEMARLDELEEQAEEAEEATLAALQAARAKRTRLHKQRNMLKHREQWCPDTIAQHVANLEVLEAREELSTDVKALEDELMTKSLALD
jgi:hypothetical protein